MRSLQKTAALCKAVLARPAAQAAIIRYKSTSARDALRAKYQVPGHEPVWSRGGASDKALFSVTVALITVGTLHTAYRIYSRL